jgi:hypothetical protein
MFERRRDRDRHMERQKEPWGKKERERGREREKDFKELAHIINGAVKSEIYRTGHRLETNKS